MCLGLSALGSDPTGRTPWVPTWIPGLGGKTDIFSRGALTWDYAATACKTSCYCFLPFARASFAPNFDIQQYRGWPGTPRWEPMGCARCPRLGDPGMAPSPLKCTPAALSRCRRIGPHLELRPETQGSYPIKTGILGFLSDFNRGVRPHLVLRHGSPFSSRVVKGVSGLLSSSGGELELFLEVQQGSQTSLCIVRRYTEFHSSCCWGIRPYL